jgi:hypothetical protein
MPPKPAHAALVVRESRGHSGAAEPAGVLPASLAALAAAGPMSAPDAAALPEQPRAKIQEKTVRTLRVVTTNGASVAGDSLHPAARKLLIALAQHAPARFTWGQAATLAGLKPRGGHFNAGRKSLRESGYIEEAKISCRQRPED